MAREYYHFSEEDDTSYGPYPTFDEAVAHVEEDDIYSSIFVVEDDDIVEVHTYDDGTFDEDSDSPYLGMSIDAVG